MKKLFVLSLFLATVPIMGQAERPGERLQKMMRDSDYEGVLSSEQVALVQSVVPVYESEIDIGKKRANGKAIDILRYHPFREEMTGSDSLLAHASQGSVRSFLIDHHYAIVGYQGTDTMVLAVQMLYAEMADKLKQTGKFSNSAEIKKFITESMRIPHNAILDYALANPGALVVSAEDEGLQMFHGYIQHAKGHKSHADLIELDKTLYELRAELAVAKIVSKLKNMRNASAIIVLEPQLAIYAAQILKEWEIRSKIYTAF